MTESVAFATLSPMFRMVPPSSFVSQIFHRSTRHLAVLTLVGASFVSACSDDGDDSTPTNTTSTTSSTTTTPDETGDDTETTTATTSETTSSGTTSGTDSQTTTDPTDTTDTTPNANGEPCTVDADCESQACHAVEGAAQGLCSECKDDAGCQAAGTGKACVPKFDGTGTSIDPLYWICGAGALGDTCEAETSCMDELQCAMVSVAGMDAQVCSECETNADCTGDESICNLNGSVSEFKFYLECVAPDSLENDQPCTPQADGVDACKDFCVEVKAGGSPLTNLGACGACRPDHAEEDCGTGKTCEDATIALSGLTGSFCK